MLENKLRDKETKLQELRNQLDSQKRTLGHAKEEVRAREAEQTRMKGELDYLKLKKKKIDDQNMQEVG